jgi:hypothetical protein
MPRARRPSPTTSVPNVNARPRPAAAPQDGDWWPVVMDVDHAPPIGTLLAGHPDAASLTDQLLADLTVGRLMAITDALHNPCRLSRVRASAPGDQARQSSLCWERLLVGADQINEPPSGWTKAAELLEIGSTAGLPRVSELEIDMLAGVCARIVRYPYRWACEGPK